jgi:hypothetical protein
VSGASLSRSAGRVTGPPIAIEPTSNGKHGTSRSRYAAPEHRFGGSALLKTLALCRRGLVGVSVLDGSGENMGMLEGSDGL